MLLSMTGYGESFGESANGTCSVEIRTVNNRFLKISTRITDSHQSLQDRLERIVRQRIRRGSITLNVRVRSLKPTSNYQINRHVLEAYLEQLAGLTGPYPQMISHLLDLPGVVEEAEHRIDVEADWDLIQTQLNRALDQLDQMRTAEGAATYRELVAVLRDMSKHLDSIDASSSETVNNYRGRLLERVNALLAEHGVSVDDSTLVREVAIFAERCDIAEEITRLRSHLEQFEKTLESDDSPGRKLDFLTQEMYRETNTIGSKANDARVSQLVVELKGKIEQAREIVQNIE